MNKKIALITGVNGWKAETSFEDMIKLMIKSDIQKLIED